MEWVLIILVIAWAMYETGRSIYNTPKEKSNDTRKR